jgi:glycosyltransferase involved in cell wall biosynthesis
MSNYNPNLSVIVPVFNEEKRLFHLEEICSCFTKETEIIVVNDGSTDTTKELIHKYSKKYRNIKLVSYSPNRGKGYAVRTGMLAAAGRYRLFLDIDLSTSPKHWQEFRRHLSAADVIIGSRRSPNALIAGHQPVLRENMGRVFTWLSQFILDTPVNDFTCGFKVFSAAAAEKVFSRSKIDRWGYDAEILFIAHSLRLKILSLPVTWTNDPATRVSLFRDTLTSLRDLFYIRLNSLLGKYR